MKPISILVLFNLIALLLLSLATLTGCEKGIMLRVENKLETNIIIFLQGFKNSVPSYGPIDLGVIPAGQEAQMRKLIVLDPDVIECVNIRAQDLQGNEVWQNTWTLDEFLLLKKTWWQIKVSPNTGSYLPSY